MSQVALAQWDILSRTDPKLKWKVTLYNTGRWACACPKWKFARGTPKPDCHHIAKVKGAEQVTAVAQAAIEVLAKPNGPTINFMQKTRAVYMDDDV